MKPKITIAIPTYNRVDVLVPCLRSLQQQTMRDFICIVLDDGSTDETPQAVQAIVADDARFQYRAVTGGVIKARNSGFAGATTPLLMTFDDDVELVDNTTLAFVVAQFEQDEQLGILGLSEYFPGGRNQDGDNVDRNLRSWRDVWRDTRYYQPGKINRWGWMGTRFERLPYGEMHTVDHVRSSSMAIRREAFEAVGGFYEPYTAKGYGYRYETDLCVRIQRKGYTICYSAMPPQTYHKAAEHQRGWQRGGYDETYMLYTNRNNMFFFLRNYWHPLTGWLFLLWDMLVGATPQPGILRIATQYPPRTHRRALTRAALKGKWWGWRMYWQHRHTGNATTTLQVEQPL